MEDQKVLIPPEAPPVYSVNPAVRIVSSQPLAQEYHTNPAATHYPSDNFFTLSVFLAFFWCIFGSCGLCCVIPAIVYAVHAREAEMRGDMVAMRSKRQAALALNIIGSIVGLITLGLTIAWYVMSYRYEVHHAEDGTPTPTTY
uniref:DUF4190 domain-containing protein n=1 Tax=Amphimedon queenslandica TaxID=400682 RepID=A0A1X7VV26_AMPQE